jgi:hypothetical protein
MPPGFLGMSLEYWTVARYTGRNPRAVNPVLVRLLRNLAPAQVPSLRIGGDSADETWWPIRSVLPPSPITQRLTDRWLRTTRALANAIMGKLILDLNLAGHRPAIAATEARALRRGIGQSRIQAFEIGNEPDLFPFHHYRPYSYGLADYIREYSTWRTAIGFPPIAAGALGTSWTTGVDQFVQTAPGAVMATFHRYPLHACFELADSPRFATITNLLSPYSSTGMADGVAQYVADAHSRGIPLRLDEVNSASCGGKKGVSDVFASALWAVDAMFELARVGVDGVNFHTSPGSPYELFPFTHSGRRWSAFVRPAYYGLLMFSEAYPPGARMLPVNSSDEVKAWATQAPDGTRRLVLINKDTSSAHSVLASTGTNNASIEWLTAPSVTSTDGVTLGGRTFGSNTTTGALPGQPQRDQLSALLGQYSIELPAASAALLTF